MRTNGRSFLLATLISALAFSGCRNSSGVAVASGTAFLYLPGTTTAAAGYKDPGLTQVWTTVNGGIPLDAGGRANIWVNQQVDVVIADATGAPVTTLSAANAIDADTVVVTNPGYTGAITDPVTGLVTQGLGGATDLDTALSSAAASIGPNFQYQESPGATSRPVAAVLRGIQVTPEDFGAVGNNIVDDTAALQAAINEVARLKGGKLFLAGAYKTSITLTVPASTGVTIAGFGGQGFAGTPSTINFTGAGDALASTGSTKLRLDGVTILGSVTLTNPASPTIVNSVITGPLSGTTYGLTVAQSGSGTATGLTVRDSTVFGATNALVLNGLLGAALEDSTLQSEVAVISIAGATGSIYGSNLAFSGVTGVLWAAGASGANFAFANSPSLGNGDVFTAFDLSNLSADPGLIQTGNGVESIIYAGVTGGTFQIKMSDGNAPFLSVTSGGAGNITVANPVPTPPTNTKRAIYMTLTIVNNSGGTIGILTGSQFRFSGSLPNLPNTDALTVQFRWDPVTSLWRATAAVSVTGS